MSDDRTRTTILQDAQEEDIEFTIVKPNPTMEDLKGLDRRKKTTLSIKEKIQAEKSQDLKLEKINYASRGPKATLTEHYRELEKREQQMEEDLYDFASPVSRGIALVLDLGFLCSLIYGAIIAAPYELLLIDFFNNKYSLVLSVPRTVAQSGLTLITIFLTFFLFVVIPTAFYNRSFGKKIMRLYVRGTETYTLSVGQIFMRELICKPLSIGLLIGLVFPLFDKKKQSLHDKMVGTLVIKE